MGFGLGFFGIGRLGGGGAGKKVLPAGQTRMHAFGQAVVTFLAPTYASMSAAGTATVSLVGATGGGGGGAALQADMSSTSSEWFFIL